MQFPVFVLRFCLPWYCFSFGHGVCAINVGSRAAHCRMTNKQNGALLGATKNNKTVNGGTATWSEANMHVSNPHLVSCWYQGNKTSRAPRPGADEHINSPTYRAVRALPCDPLTLLDVAGRLVSYGFGADMNEVEFSNPKFTGVAPPSCSPSVRYRVLGTRLSSQ